MKRVMVSALILMSLVATANGELLPAEHNQCTKALSDSIEFSCDTGAHFYVGTDGRCGCLRLEQITKPRTCMAALIRCPKDSSYSSLYRLNNNGVHQWKGCGCFSSSADKALAIH